MKSPHVTRVEVEEAPSNSKKSSDLKTKSTKGINDLDEVEPARANCRVLYNPAVYTQLLMICR